MSGRTVWTLREAVEHTGASKSTLRRAVAEDRIAGAYKNPSGIWCLPVEGLIAAGYPPRAGAGLPDEQPAPAVEPATASALHERVRELEAALQVAQAEKRAAETIARERQQVADAHAQRADTAERALLMLETAPTGGAHGGVQGVFTERAQGAHEGGHERAHDHPFSGNAEVRGRSEGVLTERAQGVHEGAHEHPQSTRPRRWWSRLIGH